MSASERRAPQAPGKRRRHRHHGNPFSVRGAFEAPELLARFGRRAPLALDIGFGEGRFLLDLAARHPEWDVIGIEIRKHLVDEVNAQASALGLTNALAVLGNVNEHLRLLVPDGSVAFVAINFPDPWFKKRHQKRRVVRAELVKDLAGKLAAGATVHVMSDYEPIAVEIRAAFEAHPAFENLDGRGAFASESTTGIVTEREIKHTRRGEPIYRVRLRFLAPTLSM